MSQRVLVTGSAGRLGRAVVAGLTARGHTVVGFDLKPTPGLPESQSYVGSLRMRTWWRRRSRTSTV